MSGHKFFALAIALALAHFCFGQNFELVENKGQWDNAVRFKAGLINGAFYLGQQGYRITQYNSNDYQKLHNLMHGDNTKTPTETITKLSSKNTAVTNNSEKVGLTDPSSAIVLRSHTYKVTFDQSSTNATIVPEKVQIGYNNYFYGNDASKWASKCKIFGGVVYKNMYPGIDVRYYSDQGKLKYDIVVQPNADVSKLALKYDGTNGLEINNNELIIKTTVGDTKEQFPYSYQLVDGIRTQVSCKFKIYGNTVKYQLGNFDHTKTLVIDPTLVFSSFTGSTSDNWGYTATYGPDGSMFGGGIVFGSGYPVSNGAAQTTFGGGSTNGEGVPFDIGIIKLSPNGSSKVYATYVGGNGNEAPHSMVVDAQGNLIVAGRTTSTNFPSKVSIVPSPRVRPVNDWDIVVFKISADGSTLSGAIQIGGDGDDGVNIRNKYPSPTPNSLQQNYGDDSRSEVIIDGNSIWLASCTQSTNFPVTANAAQPTKSGLQDGLLLQFNANLTTCNYATHIGGDKDDAAYVISASPTTGNIFVGGGTSSTNFPGDHAGTVGPTFTGSGSSTSTFAIDGFVAEYSQTGTLLKSTYIGTATGITQVYGLKFDRFGFPYIMGTTTGTFPVINAAFGTASGKQYVAKLKTDLSGYVYSTAFGSGAANPNISPVAFLVDRCENVYLSGWGGLITNSTPSFPSAGTKGLPTTSDAIQTTTDGSDLYFFVLAKDAASQLYGSFFGQNGGATDHVDGGTSRFDATGIIYQAICANCSDPNNRPAFPVTPGVWGPRNLGTDCNEALVKIAFNFSGVHSGVKASIKSVDGDTTGCVPLTINFRDTIALAQSYSWDFGDGSAGAITTTPNIAHTYNSLGTFSVRLIATDTSKCFPYDTTFTNVRIRDDSSHLSANALKLPPCTSTTYQFTNSSIPYAKAFNSTSFLWIWGDNSPNAVAGLTPPITHTFPGTGTYNVKLVLTDTNFCNAPDTLPLIIRVAPNVKATFTTPIYGCAPYNAIFNNTSTGGLNFFWDFGDGNTSTKSNPTNLYTTPGLYTVKLIAYDSTACNGIDSTSFTVTVSDKPMSSFSYSPNPAQENIMNTFINLSKNGTHYNWLFGDGTNLLTLSHDTTVRHQYQQTNTFTACLIAINNFGCPDTSCQNLTTIIVPILDVPNAFTPNGDGVNDKANVEGVGISKLIFKIYNRLGQLVFQTTDYTQGWDGTFNGKPQPMDAYGYTLDAQFYDGKTMKKSGNITLLR